jgi:hypothetical protein
MLTVVRLGLCSVLVVPLLLLGRGDPTRAEPSPECRTLAKQFAEAPDKLEVAQLIELRKCVGREVKHRGGGKAKPEPASEAAPAAPTD